MKLTTTICCLLAFTYSFAQNNVGIGTTNPQAQLHTTGTVRHDTLSGQGFRFVYASTNGSLTTQPNLANNTAFNIPDNSCAGITSAISVSDMPAAISSAAIQVKVNISHTNDGDVGIYLISPSGQVLNLAFQNGGAGNNFINTIFSDGGATSISAVNPPFTGTFKPLGSTANTCASTPISTFGGLGSGSIVPNGVWTLKVVDVAAAQTGMLTNWSISFDGAEPVTLANLSPNRVPRGATNGFLVDGSIFDNGNVGIGTNQPLARLHVADSSVVFTGLGNSPVAKAPVSGAGYRMMWFPQRAAFRAGGVGSSEWDTDSIGYYSFAAGTSTKAKGFASVALGLDAAATGFTSTAMGSGTIASGSEATAMGNNTIASGDYGATAMGASSTASGDNGATAIGYLSTASGNYGATAIGVATNATGDYGATAMGRSCFATGLTSIAMGRNCTASGDYSTAIGSYVSTGGSDGALVMGDHSTTTVLTVGVANSYRSRFDGGYRFFSNSALSAGVTLAAGGGAWAGISDRRLKENFRTINNEDLLQKVASLLITNWNYKSQPASQRHIGPMAQDFYAAFKLDGEGADTTINTMDISGVNMAAIQALEKRTAKLNEELKIQKAFQAERLEKSENQIAELTRQNEDLVNRLQQLEALVLSQNKENATTKN